MAAAGFGLGLGAASFVFGATGLSSAGRTGFLGAFAVFEERTSGSGLGGAVLLRA